VEFKLSQAESGASLGHSVPWSIMPSASDDLVVNADRHESYLRLQDRTFAAFSHQHPGLLFTGY